MSISKFIKHALYVSHEEILLKADINLRIDAPNENEISIMRIEMHDKEILFDHYLQSNVADLYTISRIERYFALGCQCFIAMKHGDFIGHLWCGNSSMTFEQCDPALRYVGQTYDLNDDVIFAIDFFVVPEERGGGTALEFLSKAWSVLQKLGYNHCLGFVQPHNRAARWMYMLCGFEEIGRVKVHRVFNCIVLIGWKLYYSPHALSS